MYLKVQPIKQSFYYKSFIRKVNLGQGQILGQGRGQGQCGQCLCVWLHQLSSPDVSVDSAEAASSGLIL